jgi:hypothetical protein
MLPQVQSVDSLQLCGDLLSHLNSPARLGTPLLASKALMVFFRTAPTLQHFLPAWTLDRFPVFTAIHPGGLPLPILTSSS